MDLTADGFSRLLTTLEGLGTEGITLPTENVTLTLAEARDRGWPFERAWSAAINRLQPSQIGGIDPVADEEIRERISLAESRTERDALIAQRRAMRVNPQLDAELRETRGLLEENRPYFRALYEGRTETDRERAQRIAAAWRRIDGPKHSPTKARRRRAPQPERKAA